MGSLAAYVRDLCAKGIVSIVYEGAPGRYPDVHVGRLLKHVEDVNATYTAAGICSRPPINRLYSLEEVCDYLWAGAGLDLSPTDLKRIGERIFTTLTLFNLREGTNRHTLAFPKKWLTMALEREAGNLQPLDENLLNALLDDYFVERGWAPQEGRPLAEKREELELLAE